VSRSRGAGVPTSRAALDGKAIANAARALYDAELSRKPIAPLIETYPGLDLTGAYDIQRHVARTKVDDGARLVGHKIGATSKVIQEYFGIAQPDFGHLFEDMEEVDGGSISLAALVQPLAEAELAFILAERLAGPGVTRADALAATESVVACIEIIDSRIEGWNIQLPDTVADNGSSGRFVLGGRTPINDLDLSRTSVSLRKNGKEEATGSGDAVLGHPGEAVAWLANTLGQFGESLAAGSVVLSGSFTSALRCEAGDVFEAVFEDIGSVSCTFTA